MKIAVLGNNRPSFVKPMSESFIRMCNDIDIECVFFQEGTDLLEKGSLPIKNRFTTKFKFFVKSILNNFKKDKYEIPKFIDIESFSKELKKFDLIVVVAHLPSTLSGACFTGIESLRSLSKTPIVNYDLVSWTTRGPWIEKVKTNSLYGGFTGFTRFDWYFTLSNISEFPEKKNLNFPGTTIGGNFNAQYLFPNQNGFKILLDFKRDSNLIERGIQIKVLERLQITYTVLDGSFSHEELCSVIRTHSAVFLAHRESFGLPIIEAQLCGLKIITPYKYWAPSHYINKEVTESGQGDLSSNFIVYDNNEDILEKELIKLKAEFDANRNLEIFTKSQPHFHKGNLDALSEILKKFESGELNSISHENYSNIEDEIIVEISDQNLISFDPIFNLKEFIK